MRKNPIAANLIMSSSGYAEGGMLPVDVIKQLFCHFNIPFTLLKEITVSIAEAYDFLNFFLISNRTFVRKLIERKIGDIDNFGARNESFGFINLAFLT